MANELFKPIPGALEALQEALRKAGVQHLAALVPVGPVRNEDDFLRVMEKLQTIKRLIVLRPPSARAFRRVQASLRRMNTLTAVVERVLREQYAGALTERR